MIVFLPPQLCNAQDNVNSASLTSLPTATYTASSPSLGAGDGEAKFELRDEEKEEVEVLLSSPISLLDELILSPLKSTSGYLILSILCGISVMVLTKAIHMTIQSPFSPIHFILTLNPCGLLLLACSSLGKFKGKLLIL